MSDYPESKAPSGQRRPTRMLALLLWIPAVAVSVPTDYLVLEWQSDGAIRSLYHRVVELPASPARAPAAERFRGPQAVVRDDLGNELQRVSIERSATVRGEFAGSGPVDGAHLSLNHSVFVVRIPRAANATLSILDEAAKTVRSYRVAELARQAEVRETAGAVAKGAGAGNRVRLLITGDGYTSAQQAKFNADVDATMATFFAFEPYASYRDFVSVQRLFVASNQSGADHPPACSADPLAPSFVDTAFDATFCTFDIQRLLTVNQGKVLAAASAVPDWDIAIVIVNDTSYGGSGGGVPVTSINSSAADILVHEYAHNFSSLADEYETPFPGFPVCSDFAGGRACEANVTDESVRSNVKWVHLIDPSTPVPTPFNGPFSDRIGLFEGARYLSAGIYRSEINCNMRSLAAPFCQVCREEYVQTIYAGGWGSGTTTGISLIEPGSEVPADFSPAGNVGESLQFSIETLEPTHGLDVTWLVDDNPVLQKAASSFSLTPDQAGTVQVSVQVKDRPVIVDLRTVEQLPVFFRTWTVAVAGESDVLFADSFESP